jgi:hypothetical protein
VKERLSRVLAYPFLFASYPVLFVYARSPLEVTAWSLLAALALAWCATALIFALCRLLLRHATCAAVLTGFLVVLLGYYGHAYSLLQSLPSPFPDVFRHRALLGVAMLSSAGVWLSVRRHHCLGATPYLNLIGGLLVGMSTVQVLWTHTLVLAERQLRNPLRTLPPAVGANRPSFIVLVLDEYARADKLQDLYGFDNSRFLQALKERGFTVSLGSHSNYSYTIPSLSSVLNLDYLPQSSLKRLGFRGVNFWMTFLLQNRLMGFFRDSGYRVRSLSYCSATDHFAAAQERIGSGVLDNQFIDALLQGTISVAYDAIARLDRPRYVLAQRERTLRFFDALDKMSFDRPTFLFAHVLCPHRPLVFKKDGSVVSAAELSSPGSYLRLYPEQIHYLNSRVLQAIDHLLAKSANPPVIVVMSDHGSASLALPEGGASFSEPTPALVRERLANLCAVRAPQLSPKAREQLSGVSGVNLFRVLLDGYFNTGLGLLENRYIWYSNGAEVTDWIEHGSNT